MSTRLPMRTHAEARRTLARIIRQHYRGELDDQKARTLGYLLNTMLAFFRLEMDARIENDIQKLTEALRHEEVRQLGNQS